MAGRVEDLLAAPAGEVSHERGAISPSLLDPPLERRRAGSSMRGERSAGLLESGVVGHPGGAPAPAREGPNGGAAERAKGRPGAQRPPRPRPAGRSPVFPRPEQEIGPEQLRVLTRARARVRADRRTLVMPDAHAGQDRHPPAGGAQPEAIVEILGVEAEGLVEQADLLERLAPDGERRAGDPGDLARPADRPQAAIEPEPAEERRDAAREHEQPEAGRLAASAPLRAAVRIGERHARG